MCGSAGRFCEAIEVFIPDYNAEASAFSRNFRRMYTRNKTETDSFLRIFRKASPGPYFSITRQCGAPHTASSARSFIRDRPLSPIRPVALQKSLYRRNTTAYPPTVCPKFETALERYRDREHDTDNERFRRRCFP